MTDKSSGIVDTICTRTAIIYYYIEYKLIFRIKKKKLKSYNLILKYNIKYI